MSMKYDSNAAELEQFSSNSLPLHSKLLQEVEGRYQIYSS
jgi:hypothetical protein